MVLFHALRRGRRRKFSTIFCYFMFLVWATIMLNSWEYYRYRPFSLILDSAWIEQPIKSSSVHNPQRNGLPLFDEEECKEPMHSWQDAFYPNCNEFHSIDIHNMNDDELQLLGIGGARMVWKVNDPVGQGGALKTMIYKSAVFDRSKAEHTRIDAILSERLTSSPHVIDMYGVCGQSTISEVGVVDDKWVTRKRKVSGDDSSEPTHRTNLEKLDLARQLAHALADFHGAGGSDKEAVAVWRNLKSQNVLFVNGKLKINDFDDAILFRKNATDGTACKFQLDHTVYQNKTYQPPELCFSGRNLDEKIDIYALGGILYQILTRGRPYNDIRGNHAEIKRRKENGILPSFEKIKERNDTASLAFRKAVEQCMQPDPKLRPPARQIAQDLDKAYNRARKDEKLQQQ